MAGTRKGSTGLFCSPHRVEAVALGFAVIWAVAVAGSQLHVVLVAVLRSIAIYVIFTCQYSPDVVLRLSLLGGWQKNAVGLYCIHSCLEVSINNQQRVSMLYFSGPTAKEPSSQRCPEGFGPEAVGNGSLMLQPTILSKDGIRIRKRNWSIFYLRTLVLVI